MARSSRRQRLLVLASLLMLAGSTADRMGRRRVFQIGLFVFSAGSLLCALAATLGFLIAARGPGCRCSWAPAEWQSAR